MKQILKNAITVMIATAAIIGCSKGPSTKPNNTNPNTNKTTPTVATIAATNIGFATATCGANVTSTGNADIEELGIRFGTNRASVLDVVGVGAMNMDTFANVISYSIELKNLIRGQKYYFRSYVRSSYSHSYGDLDSFTTTRGVFLKDTFAGGIVFYVDSTNEHGMCFAMTEQGSEVKWNNLPNINIAGAVSSALGTGRANTAAIIAAHGSGDYAASLCANYSGGGYHDWYLPPNTYKQCV